MRRFLLAEALRAMVRLCVAFGLFGLISKVPWPAETGHLIGVASFGFLAGTVIVVCGKLLYDTLYFDRYWRKVDTR